MISRPLDPGEAFFFMSDHVSCMNFVVFAQRSSALPLERIQPALETLQHENTLLQVRIDWTEQSGLRFEPAPGQPIALHCHAATPDNWQDIIEAELSQPFAVGSAPLMRCHAISLHSAQGNASVLALTFHHAIADGRSGVALLRRLLTLIQQDDPQRAASSANAVATCALPPMAELFPASYRWAERPQAAKELRSTLIGDYKRCGALSPLPWLATQASGRSPRFIQVSLPAAVGQTLRVRARKAGTTLHGLICAAQLLAQRTLQGDEACSTFFLSCPVDLRPHLESKPAAEPTAMMISLISNTFQLGDSTTLWQLARDIISQTRLQLARGEGHLLYWLYGLTGAPVPPSALAPFAQKALASLPNTMVSNIGAVDRVTDDTDVESISFALCPMPYQTLFTAASSYADRLILNVGFDAQRVNAATAQTLAQAMREMLLNAAQSLVQPTLPS